MMGKNTSITVFTTDWDVTRFPSFIRVHCVAPCAVCIIRVILRVATIVVVLTVHDGNIVFMRRLLIPMLAGFTTYRYGMCSAVPTSGGLRLGITLCCLTKFVLYTT